MSNWRKEKRLSLFSLPFSKMPVEWIYVAIVRLKTVQYLLNDGWKNHRADNSGLDFCRISFRYSYTCIEALTGIKKQPHENFVFRCNFTFFVIMRDINLLIGKV